LTSLEQLLAPSVPTLQRSDTGNDALQLMDDVHLAEIPLVEEGTYVALIREQDVLEWKMPGEPLSESEDLLTYKPAVSMRSHPYDVLKVLHSQDLAVIPVVDTENHYQGSITRADLLDYLVETSGIDQPGALLVLEMDPRNYSLSQIARICEQEDVTVLSSQLFNNPDTQMLEVTLKTNRMGLGGLVQSFERHNFLVKDVHGDRSDDDDLSDRYDNLMAYLNV
jgi:CBS domain-containing protein